MVKENNSSLFTTNPFSKNNIYSFAILEIRGYSQKYRRKESLRLKVFLFFSALPNIHFMR